VIVCLLWSDHSFGARISVESWVLVGGGCCGQSRTIEAEVEGSRSLEMSSSRRFD
jgi:hypothetical protein